MDPPESNETHKRKNKLDSYGWSISLLGGGGLSRSLVNSMGVVRGARGAVPPIQNALPP